MTTTGTLDPAKPNLSDDQNQNNLRKLSQLTPSGRTAWYLLEQYINGEDTPYAYYAPMTFPLPEPGEVTLALKDGWGIGRGELVELERAGLIRLTSGVKFQLTEYGKQAIEGR